MRLAFPIKIIYTDVILSLFAMLFFLLEVLLPNLQTVWVGALIGMRLLLKLFFSVSVLIYQTDLKNCWDTMKLLNQNTNYLH